MKKILRKRTVLFTSLIIVIAITVGIVISSNAAEDSFSKGMNEFNKIEEKNDTSIVVKFENGDTITKKEIEQTMTLSNVAIEENKNLISNNTDLTDAEKQELISKLKPMSYDEAIEKAVRQRVEYQTAEKLDLAPTDEEARQEFIRVYDLVQKISKEGTDEEKQNALLTLNQIEKFKKASGLSEAAYETVGTQSYKIQMAGERLLQHYLESIPNADTMTQTEISQAYDEYIEEIKTKTKFTIIKE